MVSPLLLHMDGWQIRGWNHIQKFIPLDWSVIFRRTKKVALTKIAPIGRNTCPILACIGFPEIWFIRFSYLWTVGKSLDWIISENSSPWIGRLNSGDRTLAATPQLLMHHFKIAWYHKKRVALLLLLYMDVQEIEGWYHIRKFIPLDWSVILFVFNFWYAKFRVRFHFWYAVYIKIQGVYIKIQGAISFSVGFRGVGFEEPSTARNKTTWHTKTKGS